MDIITIIIGVVALSAGVIQLIMRPCCCECEFEAVLLTIAGVLVIIIGYFMVPLSMINEALI